MIFTCTFNPSLDYYLEFDKEIKKGEVNRSNLEYFIAGGKGINVSIILNNLLIPSTAFGFIGGFDSSFYLKLLERYTYLKPNFAYIKGHTRINVKTNDSTELNARGPIVDYDARKDFLRKIEQVDEGDYFVFSGNVQEELLDFSHEVIKELKDKNVKIILDTNVDLMKDFIEYEPELIKFDLEDVQYILKEQVDEKKALEYLKSLKNKIKNIILSIDDKNSYLLCDQGIYKAIISDDILEKTYGRGDSMIAGFVFNKQRGFSDVEAYRYSACTGLATTYSTSIDMRHEIEDHYDKFELEVIE